MNKEIKEIIVNLISRIYDLESEHFDTPADRNICEAELQDIYDTLDEQLGDVRTIGDYEEEIEDLNEAIESLEEQVGELVSRNEDLTEENYNLRQILTDVSEAVSRTWN